ncbi:hypothetical protein [Chitinophaga barathri]|uniref:Uncharacterized protein n=1 Tax=Chitinophaga barathri TaxID=1647451 RepID=A0A3N4MFI9_9BACT|nr:hypothetical protein [Chitinophaga barathri]RPD42782.1 hypothetical protein EG028_00340 [Chitinophaga barathri]
MAENFKIYLLDILSVLLPGGLLVALLARFEGLAGKYASLFLTDSDNWMAIVVYIGIAYMLGHFIFFLGSYLDDILFEPYQKVFWKDPLLKAIVINFKEEKTGIADRAALNAFKWSCAWLLKHEPAMYSVVERHIAESKFFRSLVVVLLAGVIISCIKNEWWMAVTAFVLVFFSIIRYLTQRSKAIETAYQYVITASGIRFQPAESAMMYSRLMEQRVWVRETGKSGAGDFFRKVRVLLMLIFNKTAAASGSAKSGELRWFFTQPDETIETFFQSHGKSLSAAASRTDQYLSIPGRDDMSIKIREGKMEIKKRTGIPVPVHPGAHASGFLEDWEKYMFRLQDDKIPVNGSGYWLAVKKDRIGLKFSPNGQGEWAVLDIKEKTTTGCQAEYTRLIINGRESYTFALEWFGMKGKQPMPPALNMLFQNLFLDIQHSCGYNAYLNKVAMPGNPLPENS